MARSQDNDDEPMNIALEIEMVAEELGDFVSLLSGDGRDFLVRNNGVKIPIANLEGQFVALYFSASWCGPCSRFTPELVEVYNELLSNTNKFEVVFVSADQDKDSFNGYLSKMPWLAIPFSDNGTRKKLNQLFKVRGMPHLVILDSSGKILNEEGVLAVKDYGAQGYPFSAEKIRKLREDEEAAKKEQTIRSLLVSPARDYVISNDKSKVPVSDLEGKIVAVYFSDNEFRPCVEFTPVLAQIYGKLKERGERFEVVLVPLDDDESSFEEAFARMPWLAIPFQDKNCNQLARYFELSYIPTVAVIGADGKTMNVDFAELIEEHGVEAWEAFPFSQEKLDPLSEKAKAKQEAQTLESLLVSGDLDYVLGHDGKKVPVKELVGKNILLYFSSHLCPPCQAFLPKLKEEYHKIKNKDNACEVVLIAKDFSQADFEEFYSDMPWLALPFGDERKKNLRRVFKIRSIPFLVAIDPTGKTVTKEARYLLSAFGAEAYPFTEDRIKELEARIEEMAKEWPEKITLELHEHELVRTRCRMYGCAECGQTGNSWSFRCIRCEFDLHPKCALEHKEKEKATSGGEQGRAMAAENGEGYVCDGEVCRKSKLCQRRSTTRMNESCYLWD